jgi:hypothetical protein
MPYPICAPQEYVNSVFAANTFNGGEESSERAAIVVNTDHIA